MLSFSMFPRFPSFLRLSPNVLPKFLRVSYCSDLLTFLQQEINIIFKVRKCWTFKAKSGGGLHYYSFLMLQRILPAGPWAPISDPLAPKQKYSAVVAHSALRTSARLEWMFRGDWLACSQKCLGDPQDIIIAPVYPCKVSGHATELYTSQKAIGLAGFVVTSALLSTLPRQWKRHFRPTRPRPEASAGHHR